MADNTQKSIFSGIVNALRGGRKQTSQDTSREVLTGTPMPVTNVPQSLQQNQQAFLNNQYQKVAHEIYTNSLYNDVDRIGAYQDYRAMDLSPEVSAAMDIMTDECLQKGEMGNILTIYSENSRVKNVLKDLFFNRLNVDYNLMLWIREMIKYGDNFLLLEIDQHEGIYDVRELPVQEISREESYNGNLKSSRFKWDIKSMFFEEWQVGHFRMISDATRLPYGRSILEPARKLWKQLQLAEDAMLVYRIIRAPERRVHYIEVGNIDDSDIPQFIERIKRDVKKAPLADSRTGQVNLKFNPMPVWKNTPIPLLDGRTITIENLSKEIEEGKNIEVYSIQDKTHNIVPGKVIWCGKNYTAKTLTKVWLDDNTWILVAPEHPFMLRDGSFVRADELNEGDSLMPYYEDFKKIYKGAKSEYKRVYNPSNGKYEYVHRLISKEVSKEKEEYNTVHHRDFNRFNNSTSNLEWVDFKEHKKMHSDLTKKLWENEEFRNKMSLNAKKMWEDENYKKEMSEIASKTAKKMWENKEFRENHIKKISETLTRKWENNELEHVREESRKNMIIYNKSEEKIKKVSKLNKERDSVKNMSWYNTSDLHEQHNEIRRKNMNDLWSDKEKKKKHIDSMKVKIGKGCFDFIIEEIKTFDEFISAENFIKHLHKTRFLDLLRENNPTIKRDLNKIFTRQRLRKILNENGISSYENFLEKYNNSLLELKKDSYKNKMINYNKNKNEYQYKNHKVLKTETILMDGEDVYCMTVVGLNGEHDRHNFALYSFNEDGTQSSSGVFVRNTLEEDYFIPVRGDKGSRIETLAGAANLGDIQDVEYLQNKLFAALKIPKTYLNYSEALPGGATLSQADLRFSRTINRIQEAVLMELRRIANIHLYFLGFHDDIDNFKLTLTNPSTQQELLKLETMKARMDVFKEMFNAEVTAPVSYTWAMENILGFSKDDIKQILRQKKIERKVFSEIEGAVQEYMETGLFSVLDDKFRSPNFTPGAAPGAEGGGAPGADMGAGGGGGGAFDMGDLGGGGAEGLSGGETIPGGDVGGADAGAGETMAEGLLFEGNSFKNETENILLNKNKNLLSATKRMIENIDKKFIKKEDGENKEDDSQEILS